MIHQHQCFFRSFAGGLFTWAIAQMDVTVRAEPARSPEQRQVGLVLPADLLTLPKAPSQRFTIYMPQIRQDPPATAAAAWESNTYYHNPLLTWWKGRFYCAWSTTPRSEATGPMNGLLATSADGAVWSRAVQPPGWESMVPRGWHQTEDRLYVWGLSSSQVFETDDGETWCLLPAKQIRDVTFTPSNKKFLKLRSGRVMAFGMNQAGALFPTTADPTALTGWTGDSVDRGECPEIGEPNGWEGPDGVLHGTTRFGPQIWHASSRDQGAHWTPLRRQERFSDNPGNKDFGVLPDGTVWYVGNPRPGSRQELVLGLSADGWSFDRNYLIRWETICPIWYSNSKSEDRPGYEYPAGCYHDGALYICYARTRDFIEVSRVELATLPRAVAQ